MSIWTAHKVTGQHSAEEGFQGFHITLPGRPIEVGRSDVKEPMTEERAMAILSKAVDINKHTSISRMFNDQENIIGFALYERGIPIAFLMQNDAV